ncbi:MAG TPA: membrane transporter [Methanophagales archaeon]|nr:membrane transporter [Methanophagales archaeon]
MNLIPGLFIAVFLSIFVLATKAGIGCGLASLKKKEIGYVGGIYLLLSIAVNQLLELVPLSVKQLILNRDVTTVYVILFTLLSIAMLAAGIHTVKEWNSKRRDISRHSFLLLSIPCPICLTAIFISCTTLAAYTDLSSFAIGTSVGFVFFVTIIITSLLCMKFKKSPVNLGNVMIFIGSFYLLSVLLIPAYIQASDMQIAPLSISMPLDNLVLIILIILFLFFIGFLRHRIKEVNRWSSTHY